MNHQEQFYRDQFRFARAIALADAEGFFAIIQALESTGQQLSRCIGGLGDYKPALIELAGRSLLCSEIPQAISTWHTSFGLLYDELQRARNDAVHQGSYARTLTSHALDLAIILEDALMSEASLVSQFMVREIVVAQPWYPVSYVRQLMLKYAFSYLPLLDGSEWRLISESSVAQFLRNTESIAQKKRRLLMPVSDAAKNGLSTIEGEIIAPNAPVAEALKRIGDHPLLVVDEANHISLMGLLTASDLL